MSSPNPDQAQSTYYAYGTLLGLASMQKYCPNAVSLGVHRLKGYRMGFAACGPDPSMGGCTLEDDPGNTMYGILYQMPEADRENLDDISGLADGLWAVKPVTLLDENSNPVEAETFYIPGPSGPHAPTDDYIKPIKAGAREIPLPDAYIAQLDEICEAAQAS